MTTVRFGVTTEDANRTLAGEMSFDGDLTTRIDKQSRTATATWTGSIPFTVTSLRHLLPARVQVAGYANRQVKHKYIYSCRLMVGEI